MSNLNNAILQVDDMMVDRDDTNLERCSKN